MSKWLRARFHANAEDPRPVKFPPPGPFWISGYGDDHSIIVAYVKSETQITRYWPEATSIEILEYNTKIEFSERFPKPWYWEKEEVDQFEGIRKPSE